MALTTNRRGAYGRLQALLGVESMPTALRLKPFIPSVRSPNRIVAEDHSRAVLTAETSWSNLSLAQAGPFRGGAGRRTGCATG